MLVIDEQHVVEQLVPQRLAWWKKRLRISPPKASTAVTLVPATVIGAAPAASAASAAMIRLPRGLVLELDGAPPTWITALVRELARSVS